MDQTTSTIVMLVLVFLIFYFMLMRPEKKRKKQAQEMRDNLKKGDTITTIGGIVGRVVAVNADTFVIETSDDRVRMEFVKWALSSVGAQTSPEAQAPAKKDKKEDEPAEEKEEAEAEEPASDVRESAEDAGKADRDPWDEPEKKD